MENTIDFKQWAEQWWRKKDETKNIVTASDIDFLGWRLRKAIDAVFGFEDCEKIESMYDNVEANELFPDMILPLDQEDEKNNWSVLAVVEKMPEEEWPEHFRKKVARIKALEKEKKATIKHLNKLKEAAPNDIIASVKRKKTNDKIEAKEEEIRTLKEKLAKAPFGKEPIFKEVGEMEGELYDFLLEKIGRGGSFTDYSYVDIQYGYWEKVDINDRQKLNKLVKELCEKKGWHIAFGFGDYLNNQFDLKEFSKKIFFPQIYRCIVKTDGLLRHFTDITDIKALEGNDQFLTELEVFKDIDKQLDKLLKKTENIRSSITDRFIKSQIDAFSLKR